MHKLIEHAAIQIKNSSHLVVLTGAGISRESGLPDYRGMWNEDLSKENFYKLLTIDWNKVKPNITHQILVKLQEKGILKFLISQNIDNLHIQSGIKEELIAELHGNINRVRCEACGKKIEKRWDRPSHCTCGGQFHSSVVKFGDKIPQEELYQTLKHTKKADVFLVLGSSLITQPAGNLPRIAKKNGATIIIINKGQTALDHLADIKIDAAASMVLLQIMDYIEPSDL